MGICMEQYVITISRQFGSMGRSIAKELSENLGIEFLDRDIVEATAKRMGLPVSVISDEEESMKSTFFRRQYPLGMGMSSLKDEIFYTQKNIIRDFAAKGSCIIVGRCADYALASNPDCLSIFVHADMDDRIKRVSKRDTGMTISCADDAAAAGEALIRMGAKAVLIKGGHMESSIVVTDCLCQAGQAPKFLPQPKVETNNNHGTGCTLSAAIATGLGHGLPLQVAVTRAQEFLNLALRKSYAPGKGCGPVNHAARR